MNISKTFQLTRKCLCGFMALVFAMTSVGTSSAQTLMKLPVPGAIVHVSEPFNPILIKGVQVHPENAMMFDFIVDPGDRAASVDTDEVKTLIKYFMASLAVPEDDLWVNLSPYENNRIVPEALGLTEMGRDMLAQDYLLKQIMASLINPEDELGKKFWERIYKQAYERYGTSDIPVDTFNKVWIMPGKAVVYENKGKALIVESSLKVMLESDYLAATSMLSGEPTTTDEVKNIIREIILPAIEQEVNTGKNFAQLRQIYHSLILAHWFKKSFKKSILNKMYADRSRIKGIDLEDKDVAQKIYARYVESFKKGVYNYVKEEVDPVTREMIPRKYFSGGVVWKLGDAGETTTDKTRVIKFVRGLVNGALMFTASLVGLAAPTQVKAQMAPTPDLLLKPKEITVSLIEQLAARKGIEIRTLNDSSIWSGAYTEHGMSFILGRTKDGRQVIAKTNFSDVKGRLNDAIKGMMKAFKKVKDKRAVELMNAFADEFREHSSVYARVFEGILGGQMTRERGQEILDKARANTDAIWGRSAAKNNRTIDPDAMKSGRLVHPVIYINKAYNAEDSTLLYMHEFIHASIAAALVYDGVYLGTYQAVEPGVSPKIDVLGASDDEIKQMLKEAVKFHRADDFAIEQEFFTWISNHFFYSPEARQRLEEKLAQESTAFMPHTGRIQILIKEFVEEHLVRNPEAMGIFNQTLNSFGVPRIPRETILKLTHSPRLVKDTAEKLDLIREIQQLDLRNGDTKYFDLFSRQAKGLDESKEIKQLEEILRFARLESEETAVWHFSPTWRNGDETKGALRILESGSLAGGEIYAGNKDDIRTHASNSGYAIGFAVGLTKRGMEERILSLRTGYEPTHWVIEGDQSIPINDPNLVSEITFFNVDVYWAFMKQLAQENKTRIAQGQSVIEMPSGIPVKVWRMDDTEMPWQEVQSDMRWLDEQDAFLNVVDQLRSAGRVKDKITHVRTLLKQARELGLTFKEINRIIAILNGASKKEMRYRISGVLKAHHREQKDLWSEPEKKDKAEGDARLALSVGPGQHQWLKQRILDMIGEGGFLSATDMVEQTLKTGREMGVGSEGQVLEIAALKDKKKIEDICLKVDYMQDFIPGDGQLRIIDNVMYGYNVGQVIAVIGNVQVLLTQRGNPAGISIEDTFNLIDDPGLLEKKYTDYLQMIVDFPQESYDRFAEVYRVLKDRGWEVDAGSSQNLMVDDVEKSFNLIDVGPARTGGHDQISIYALLFMLIDADHLGASYRLTDIPSTVKESIITVTQKLMKVFNANEEMLQQFSVEANQYYPGKIHQEESETFFDVLYNGSFDLIRTKANNGSMASEDDHMDVVNRSPQVEGGIDFKSQHMNVDLRGEGIDFQLPEGMRPMDLIGMEGLTPVIIRIAPVENLSAYLFASS